jgi:hypothetical protein
LGRLISRIKYRTVQGLATIDQVKTLLAVGVDPALARGMRRDQALNTIRMMISIKGPGETFHNVLYININIIYKIYDAIFINIASGMIALVGTMFTGIMAYLMARLNKKAEAAAVEVKEVKTTLARTAAATELKLTEAAVEVKAAAVEVEVEVEVEEVNVDPRDAGLGASRLLRGILSGAMNHVDATEGTQVSGRHVGRSDLGAAISGRPPV